MDVAPHLPEPPKDPAEPHCLAGVATLETPIERRAEVVMVDLEAVEPFPPVRTKQMRLGFLGQRDECLNVTVTNPSAGSYLTIYPTGAGQPPTSDLNVTPGVTVTNLVIAALGADGKVVVFNAAGYADLIIDVEGWYS